MCVAPSRTEVYLPASMEASTWLYYRTNGLWLANASCFAHHHPVTRIHSLLNPPIRSLVCSQMPLFKWHLLYTSQTPFQQFHFSFTLKLVCNIS